MGRLSYYLAGLIVVSIFIFGTAKAYASIGVGVGTGKIIIDEAIKAGSIYTLPPIVVFNTGTENASYAMEVTLNEVQPQLKPDPAWFSFSPAEFDLAPGESQKVIPTFHPPLVTKSGDYFAYLEAHPSQTVQQGGAATIGVAAATKLSFTIAPSNIFFAVYYRVVALFQTYSPWSYILLVLSTVTLSVNILRRHLRFSIKITKQD